LISVERCLRAAAAAFLGDHRCLISMERATRGGRNRSATLITAA
jgi:hypothetical protein